MKFLIACNWKLYFSYKQALDWVTEHKTQLEEFATPLNLIICPSYEALKSIRDSLPKAISIGSQDCSAYESGSYTGQVSAQSLREVGCAYTIIGHTETRTHLAQSNDLIAQKVKLALAHDLFPIIVVGEPLSSYKEQKTQEFLKEQLDPILQILHDQGSAQQIYLAYEPNWTIGTGTTADPHYIEKILNFLKKEVHNARLPHPTTLLYGGSIKSENIDSLLKISLLEGFLIGKGSTDFQELKKIVSLVKNRFS